VIHTLSGKAILACVIGKSCCVIQQLTLFLFFIIFILSKKNINISLGVLTGLLPPFLITLSNAYHMLQIVVGL
jgi:hypothetical protein